MPTKELNSKLETINKLLKGNPEAIRLTYIFLKAYSETKCGKHKVKEVL